MGSCKNIWKPELYRIQMEAPKPKRVVCEDTALERPDFYGKEYHGVLGHKEAAALLQTEPNGAFLVRKGSSTNDFYTLTWRFNDSIHHYKLYYDGAHYMKDKRYESVWALAADGLVMSHMELRARHILDAIQSDAAASYTESPYLTLNRRKLNSLSRTSLQQKQSEMLEKLTISDSVESDTMKSTDPLLSSMCAEQSLSTDDTVPGKYSKPHSFKLSTFKGLNWCELCANFLWGFTAQGVKCEDCGFIAHSKCSERVPAHCVPDLKSLRGVFGLDLTTLLSAPAHANALPFVVRRCIGEIETRGLDAEGLYRVSGFADEIDALKMAFDKDGEDADLSVFGNINVVAGALKLYLRLLPVPLVTYDVHSRFLNTTNANSIAEQVRLMRECLALLPPAHYDCLQYVIKHLHRVTLLAEINKMSAHNLSTVFAPTLVATPPAVTDLTFEIRALQALIELSPQIYSGET